jgi:hypothetical protein
MVISKSQGRIKHQDIEETRVTERGKSPNAR